MLKFNPSNHTYTYNEEQYISVTTLIKEFEEKKDWDAIANAYAKKNGETGQYWRDLWNNKGKIAAQAGTIIHSMFEQQALENEENVFQHSTQDGLKIGVDLKNLTEGVYPELILFSNKFKVAGQSDLIKIYSDKTFDIVDFKTDREILFESKYFFNVKSKQKEKSKYLFPLNHLDECNWNKYQVQLSIYAHILEGYGFKCNKLQINHIISERNEANEIILTNNVPNILDVLIYECDYLKKEAKSVLSNYKSRFDTQTKNNKKSKKLI